MKGPLFLIGLVSLLLLSACTNGKTQSLEEFYKLKIENVDKVIIQDGSTGYSKTMVEQDQIDEFVKLIKDVLFTPQETQEERSGWRYGISLFDGEKEFNFSLNYINYTYYDSNPDIHPVVEDYYKRLDIVEK